MGEKPEEAPISSLSLPVVVTASWTSLGRGGGGGGRTYKASGPGPLPGTPDILTEAFQGMR